MTEEPHHLLPVRIYYEDTDAGGVVYHTGYLRFFERGRTESLRELGINQSTLAARPDPVLFVVRRMAVEFLSPARLDDLVQVRTRLLSAQGVRLKLEQEITLEDQRLCGATVEVACVDAGGRPRRLPGDLLASLQLWLTKSAP